MTQRDLVKSSEPWDDLRALLLTERREAEIVPPEFGALDDVEQRRLELALLRRLSPARANPPVQSPGTGESSGWRLRAARLAAPMTLAAGVALWVLAKPSSVSVGTHDAAPLPRYELVAAASDAALRGPATDEQPSSPARRYTLGRDVRLLLRAASRHSKPVRVDCFLEQGAQERPCAARVENASGGNVIVELATHAASKELLPGPARLVLQVRAGSDSQQPAQRLSLDIVWVAPANSDSASNR